MEARDSYSAYQKSEQQYESSVLRYSRTSKEKAEEMEEELALAQKAHHLATSNASVSANLVLDKTGVVLAESVLMMAVMSSTLNLRTQEINGNLERGIKSSTILVNRESSIIDARLKILYNDIHAKESQLGTTTTKTATTSSPLPTTTATTITDTTIEGYLLKQSSSMVKNWTRKYFVIKNRKLFYYDDNDSLTSSGSGRPKHILDIVLTTAKPRPDVRRLCFEVIAPTKTFLLQAESMSDYKRWMAVLENARADALEANSVSETATVLSLDSGSAGASTQPRMSSSSTRSSSSSSLSLPPRTGTADKSSIIESLWSLQPDNKMCCDCGAESKKKKNNKTTLFCFTFFA